MKVLHVAGPAKSGKTALIEPLTELLPVRMVIKWTHHHLQPDKAGSDTARYGRHGVPTLLSAPDGMVFRGERVDRSDLYRLVARNTADCDLIIVEGDKYFPRPKIWIGEAPPAGIAVGLVIGSHASPGVPWHPAQLPLVGGDLQDAVDFLVHAWEQYTYVLKGE